MDKKKAKIVSFYFQKGGVGKTTAAINIAGVLSTLYADETENRKNKVLLVDGDAHASATKYLGHYDPNADSIYDIFKGKKSIPEVTNRFQYKYGKDKNGKDIVCSIDFVPSSEIMSDVETNYYMFKERDFRDGRFHLAFQEVIYDYDYIIIDCPPQNQALFKNIFNVTDYFIFCIEISFLALGQLAQSKRTINDLTTMQDKNCGKVLGVLLYRYEPNFKISIDYKIKQKDIMNTIERQFHIFDYKIPFSECISSASYVHMPLPFYYKTTNHGRETHAGLVRLTKEIVERINKEE